MPVGDVLPDIARDVEQTIAIGREGGDWRSAFEAVCAGFGRWECALPCIGQELAVGIELVAPREALAVEPAARRELVSRFVSGSPAEGC
jgi:hypothetical protein